MVTQQDSRVILSHSEVMKRIAAVTMFFLPATTIAVSSPPPHWPPLVLPLHFLLLFLKLLSFLLLPLTFVPQLKDNDRQSLAANSS